MTNQAHPSLRGPVLRTLAAVSCFLLLALASFAADAAKKTFDLPAGDAEKTLQLYIEQSGEQVLFPPTKVTGIQTNAVHGEMTTSEALDAMLSQTKLIAVRNEKTGAYTIQKAATVADAEKNGSSRPASDRAAVDVEGKPIVLDTFEVFGKKSLNMDLRRSREDAQPYVVLGREVIERSGAITLEDFMKQRLPMNATITSNGQTPGGTAGNNSSINLRGLGANQTLILVDGHRMANTYAAGTPGQPNINGIPLNAVERIEVLAATASGIYGGSATGGVVNIILRRDYVGSELKLTYTNNFQSDGAERRVDFTSGFTLEEGKTRVLIAASATHQNSLPLGERDFSARGRAEVFKNVGWVGLNVSGTIPPLGATTNISSVSGQNLTLRDGTPLNAAITHVPAGYLGATSDNGAGLVGRSGSYNVSLPDNAQPLGGLKTNLLAGGSTEALSVAVRRSFRSNLEAFIDASANRHRSSAQGNGTVAIVTLAPSIAANPFSQTVFLNVPISGSDAMLEPANSTLRLLAGVLFQLPYEWQGEADYTWTKYTNHGVTSPALSSAGTATIASGAINVLQDPSNYEPMLASFFNPSRHTTSWAITQDASVRLAGPGFKLPGGMARIATLLSHTEDHYPEFSQTNAAGAAQVLPSRSQSVDSAYLEWSIPLISEVNQIRAVREFELQLASRWDAYTVRGVTNVVTIGSTAPVISARSRDTSLNHTIAARYVAREGMALRGSYGSGFLPPTVNQIVPNQPTNSVSSQLDARRGNAPIGAITVTSGGNPNLSPEYSESWSAGLVFNPPVLRGLRLSVDWTRIIKTDNISTFPNGTTGAIQNESVFPDRVIRDPAAPGDPFGVGPIRGVDTTLINLARTEVEAFDATADWSVGSKKSGKLDVYAMATWQTHLKNRLTRDQPLREFAGSRNISAVPSKFRMNLGATFAYREWNFGFASQYYSPYFTTIPTAVDGQPATDLVLRAQGNGGRVKGQIYHDLFAGYRLPARSSRPFFHDFEFQVAVLNVLNSAPPFDANASPSFYSFAGNPALARYQISVKCSF